ncbi:MAG TPA: hypothetical protein PKZ97_19575 [Azospirillaceae bacterium]|nr:hypothetical protein [Azospirillaceae bacterium]
MTSMSTPVARQRVVYNVEMDDRTVLFPCGNFLSHVAVSEERGEVKLEAVFHFNEQRADTVFAIIDVDDARDLARGCLEAVFQGRTQHVLSNRAKIAVVFNPNGFVLRFGEERALKELFIASPAIIRLAQGIMRIADRIDAPPAN